MSRPGDKPTLQDILMAEKCDFEAKVQRAAKRKRWLKGKPRNRTLLVATNLAIFVNGGIEYTDLRPATIVSS